MRIPIIVTLMALLSLSLPIINYLSPMRAEPTGPCGTCKNPDNILDCLDDTKCKDYYECYRCCRYKIKSSAMECFQQCSFVFNYHAFPSTSEIGKIVLTLFIVGSAIYLMRKRIGVAKS